MILLIKEGVIKKNIKTYNSTPMKIKGIKDKVITKVPIILTRSNLNFTINCTIKLMDDIGQIESVKNKLIIDTAHVIKQVDKLNIKGKIRKTIYYSQKDDKSYSEPCISNLKFFVVHIPFEIDTKLGLGELGLNNICSNEYRIYCEPICSKIIDHIFLVNNINSDNKSFDSNTLIDVLNLFIKLDILQEQKLIINPLDLVFSYTESTLENEGLLQHGLKKVEEVLEDSDKENRYQNNDMEVVSENYEKSSNLNKNLFMSFFKINSSKKKALVLIFFLRFFKGL